MELLTIDEMDDKDESNAFSVNSVVSLRRFSIFSSSSFLQPSEFITVAHDPSIKHFLVFFHPNTRLDMGLLLPVLLALLASHLFF